MWFELKGDTRLGRCATEGCGGQPTCRLEADGVGSNYCSGCKEAIERIAAPTSPKWAVSAIYPNPKGRPEAKFLGHIIADHSPAALGKAFERWPDKIDATQPQGGFSLRLEEK